MRTAGDPFAVSVYDPDKLPAVSADLATYSIDDSEFVQLRVDEESAKVSLRHLSAKDYLTTTALAAYETGQWGVLDPARLFPEGVTTVSGGWEELTQAMVPVEETDAQKQERRARLSAAIRVEALDNEDCPRSNSRRALVHALDLDTKLRKRKEAANIAVVEGRYLARGMLPEAALKATAAELGCSLGKVRSLRSSSEYLARRDAQQALANGNKFRAVIYQHAADGWFAGDNAEEWVASANRVAARIIELMREATRGKTTKGKRPLLPPIHLRWDAFVMIEGFAKRRIPLTPVACAMVDQALGLFDCDGVPVAAPFVGVRKRAAFVAAAETEGTEELDPSNMAGISGVLDAMRENGLPSVGPKQLRKWRADESFQSIAARSRMAEERRLAQEV